MNSVRLDSLARVLATCLIAGAPASAYAQAATGQSAADAGADRAAADDAEPSAGDIVVTGSRVIRNGDEAPQPITIVPTEELLRNQPTTVADGLNALPVFAGSRGPNTSVNIGAGSGNGAANSLNLRNLGSIRGLILIDNQRAPAALANGVVDTDIIPDLLLQRVDVVATGGSAVYGADAISGVVNFITSKTFNGIKGNAQYGISQRGDAPQYKLAIAAGTKLGDRGHIEGSYTYYHADPLFSRLDRSFGYDGAYGGLILNPTNNPALVPGTVGNPFVFFFGARNTAASAGGKITSGVLANQNFKTDGVLSPFDFGTPTGSANLSKGGDGFYFNTSLGATQRNHQFYGRFDYDLADGLNFHAQSLYSIKHNVAANNPSQLTNLTIRARGTTANPNDVNAFLPAGIRAAVAAANQTTFNISKVLFQAERLDADVMTKQFFVNAGLDGEFGAFDWAVDGNYGHTNLHNALHGNPNNQRILSALDAVVDPCTGQIACRINTSYDRDALGNIITSNNDPACVPLNIFGPTASSQAAIDYILGTTNTYITNETWDFTGHIGVELFDFGAGPARAAASAEYRSYAYAQRTDHPANEYADCTGLSFNCVSTGNRTTLFQNVSTNRSRVTQKVKEAGLEVVVPLLKDTAVARAFELSGAARYADYNTSGTTWVYKIGANWQVVDDLRLRGTYSRDFRAPTLFDLFQAQTTTIILNPPDLLTGVANNLSISGGNPDLKPEKSRTWTVGGVYKPGFLPGLRIALDYYNIRINDALQNVNGFTLVNQQLCLDSKGSSPFCALQIRPIDYVNTSPANAPTFLSRQLNYAKVQTYGVDGELNYASRLFGNPFSVRLFTTYQPHIRSYQPGIPYVTDGGGAANGAAKWRINASVHIEPTEWLSFDVRERWRSHLRFDSNPTLFFAQGVAATATTDLAVVFKIPGTGFEGFLNVQNLFDKTPPPYNLGQLPGQSFVPGDDFLLRYFLAGVRFRL